MPEIRGARPAGSKGLLLGEAEMVDFPQQPVLLPELRRAQPWIVSTRSEAGVPRFLCLVHALALHPPHPDFGEDRPQRNLHQRQEHPRLLAQDSPQEVERQEPTLI